MNFLEYYRNKTIVITGAGGFIGSALAEALNEVACNLRLHIHKSKPDLKKGRASIIVQSGDIIDPAEWKKVLPGADIVFHLAEHHYNTFDPEKDLAITAKPVLDLLQFIKNNSLQTKVVFASSSNLVGLTDNQPVDEETPSNPLTIYAIHKYLAEKYLEFYSREFDIKTVTLRLANVYGPVLDKEVARRAVLNFMITQGLEKGEMALFSNKDRIRDFIYISDAVRAFLAAGAVDGNGQYFVIGSAEGKSLENIVNLAAGEINRLANKDVRVVVDKSMEISEVEKRDFTADFGKFKKATGWEPEVALQQGIKNTVNYFLL